MNISFGKRDVTQIAKVLEGDFASADEAAEAVLSAAWELYESKAQYVVIGSSRRPLEGLDAHVSLGLYGTRTQAQNAGHALAYSASTGEEFDWLVLPVAWGTPASGLHAWRKKAFAERSKAREATKAKQAKKDQQAWEKARRDKILSRTELDDWAQRLINKEAEHE